MFYAKIILTAGLALLCGIGSAAQSAETAALKASIDGLRNANGVLIVAAFDKAKPFSSMDMAKAAALAVVPAREGSVSVTFHDLPVGSYAIAAFHDEDRDGDLDMKGEVPTEGYGFAAMGRRGLPSKFEDAAVAIEDAEGSKLRLKYWK